MKQQIVIEFHKHRKPSPKSDMILLIDLVLESTCHIEQGI